MNELKLFAHGDEFDVDAFLASTELRPDRVWRRGDLRRGYEGMESRHPTSGVEFVLGDGRTMSFREQEAVAVAYLETHVGELQALARLPGVEVFILGLPYCTAVESNLVGFALGTSARLMWHCLNVGCEPTYFVSLERMPETEVEYAERDAAPAGDEVS